MYYNHRKVKKAEDDQALMGRILRHMGFKLRETKTSYPKWVRENVRITLNTISDASQPDGKLFGIWVDNRWIKDVSSVEECIRLLQEYVDPLVLWGGVLQYLPDFDMGGMVVKEGVFNELYKSTVMRLLLENYDPMERIGALNMHPDDVSTVVGLALTGDSKKVETKFNTLIMETIKRLSQEDAIAKAVEWGLVEGPNPDRIMFKEFDQFFADPTELVRYILERKEVMVMGGGG